MKWGLCLRGIDKVDERAVVAENDGGVLRFADFVNGLDLHAAKEQIDPNTEIQHIHQRHIYRLYCVFARLFMLVGVVVQLGKKNVPLADHQCRQEDQNREYTDRNDGVGHDGHISKTHADANRGQRAQTCDGNKPPVGHTHTCRQEADHTVGNGGQEI